MAGDLVKVTAKTENTAPLGTDTEYMIDAGTGLSNRILKGSNNLLNDGFMINGVISVTVASSNITVAIKTRAGADPSATDPVSIWIAGTYRRITAATSVTKNAGTQWFNLDARFAAIEQDFFVYLIWNTTPATDIIDIGFARIPYGKVYSDFSGTTTNEKYLAFGNASTPTSTDTVVNIGRFAATLSATASYNWSVPTFTESNLINRPCVETRFLSWTPQWTAFTLGSASQTANYRIHERMVDYYIGVVLSGSTMTGPLDHGIPISAKPYTDGTVPSIGLYNVRDSDTTTQYPCIAALTSTTNVRCKVQVASGTYLTFTDVTSTIPFTWANSDAVEVVARYQLA